MGKETYDPEFWGLDIETSGSDIKYAATIQIGVVAPNGKQFCELIGGWNWIISAAYAQPEKGMAFWSPEAAEVHKIAKRELEVAENSFVVDTALSVFIRENTGTDKVMNRITVGWNVGGFDMPFVRRDLPKSGALLSYRSTDLNSVLFAMIRQNPSLSFPKIKDKAKRAALAQLGEATWHNALFDAKAAMISFGFLAEALGKES